MFIHASMIICYFVFDESLDLWPLLCYGFKKKEKKKEVNIYIDWYKWDLNLGFLFDGKKNINRANWNPWINGFVSQV